MRKLSLIASVLCAFLLTIAFQNCAPSSDSGSSVSDEDLKVTGDICPMYMPPLCEDDEEIVIGVNDAGCDYPYCAKKDDKTNCPIYNRPLCQPDEYVAIIFDNNLCPMPVCEKKSKEVLCPIYNRPICETGTTIKIVKDQNGCDKPICVVY